MVARVHEGVPSHGYLERRGGHGHVMGRLVARRGLLVLELFSRVLGDQVLIEGPAQGDVDDVRAAADPQQRNVAGHGLLDQGNLEEVAVTVGDAQGRQRFLIHEGRVDVGAPGQDDPVEGVEQGTDLVAGQVGQGDGQGPGGDHGVDGRPGNEVGVLLVDAGHRVQ